MLFASLSGGCSDAEAWLSFSSFQQQPQGFGGPLVAQLFRRYQLTADVQVLPHEGDWILYCSAAGYR